MYFLKLNPVTEVFWSGVRTLFYSICTLVYKLIIYLYNLFDMLSRGRIIDSDFMDTLYSRVGLILGLLMFFRISFSFIQMLVNPDTITDKEKGAFNIIKRVLISVVLLGIVPYMFELGYKVQNILLGSEPGTSNVISRLLLPVAVDNSEGRFGEVFSEQLLFAFYDLDNTIDPDATGSGDDDLSYQDCITYKNALRNQIETAQDFSLGMVCLNSTTEVQSYGNVDETVYIMRFDYLFSLLVGLMVCWFFLVYCFSVGVRVIQLAFLQIIAPMPIVSYISPKKDGMFSKWVKMCLTTYLDVFIRVAIINFIVLLISMIMDGFFGDANSIFMASTGAYAAGKWYQRFLFVIIVLSLLQFAKKAPELLKELLPKSWAASGDFGFGLKNRSVLGEAIGKSLAVAGGVATGGAIGLVSGVAGGNSWKNRISGAVGGVLGGATRGLSNGIKTKDAKPGSVVKSIGTARKNQAAAGLKRAQRIASGATLEERIGDATKGYLGIQSGYSSYDAEYNAVQAACDAVDNTSSAKKIKEMRQEAIRNRSNMYANADAEYNKTITELKRKLSDGYLSMEQFSRDKALAETNRQGTYAAADAAVKRASKDYSDMEEAVFALSLGDYSSLEKMVNDSESRLTKDNKGDYYIAGIKVSKYDSVAETIKNAQNVSGKDLTSYDAMDKKASAINAERAKKHKSGK